MKRRVGKYVNSIINNVENSPFRVACDALSHIEAVFWMSSLPSVEGGSLIIHQSDKKIILTLSFLSAKWCDRLIKSLQRSSNEGELKTLHNKFTV